MALARIFAILLLLIQGAAYGQESNGNPFDTNAAKQALDGVEERASVGAFAGGALSDAIKRITGLRTKSSQCADNADAKLARLKASLSTVGIIEPDEPQETTETAEKAPEPKEKPAADIPVEQRTQLVTDEIKTLEDRKAKLENMATECRLLANRADELIDKLTKLQQQQLKEHLVFQSKDLHELVLETLHDPWPLWRSFKQFTPKSTDLESLGDTPLLSFSFLILLGVGLGFWLKPKLYRFTGAMGEDSFFLRLSRASCSSLSHFLPILLPSIFVAAYLAALNHGVRPPPIAVVCAFGITIYIGVLTMIRVVLSPPAPATQITPLPDPLVRALARRLKVLAMLVFIGLLLSALLRFQGFPEQTTHLAQATMITVWVVNLAWLIWLVGQIPALARGGRGIRFLLLLFLLAILVAEWLGYRNLSRYLLEGLMGTFGVGVLYWLLDKLLSEFFDNLNIGHSRWQRWIRGHLGLKGKEAIPGLMWLRFLTVLLMWTGIGIVVLRLWGLSDAGTVLAIEYFVDGFEVGNIKVVPSKVIMGIFIFGLLLTCFRWFRNVLENKWLRGTGLDAGAREAAVTITGYVGFTIAVLFGLSLAGMDMGHFAIVAGALSLGIGFGLQNVVNNFVSGLILLFERPVRTGDWIRVGQTQGYVKKIRVRSTEIQAFDRSEVIVPNSEFISAQVTNLTLRNPYGRLDVQVGVAYGSDTEKVKRVLLEVANAHPSVVKSGIVPIPKVLFLVFGDSALNFELRCFVYDINNKMDVLSDLNFAVDRAFRKHGIEIPFPQRDLHVRDSPKPTAE